MDRRSLIDYGVSLRSSANPKVKNGEGFRTSASQHDRAELQGSARVHFRALRFSVEQAYDTTHSVDNDGGSHLSDVAVQGTLFPTSILSAASTVDYSPRVGQGLDAFNFALSFQPPGQPLQASTRGGRCRDRSWRWRIPTLRRNAVLINTSKTVNSLSAVSFETYLGLFNRAGVFFAPVYDLAQSRMLASIYGVRLNLLRLLVCRPGHR